MKRRRFIQAGITGAAGSGLLSVTGGSAAQGGGRSHPLGRKHHHSVLILGGGAAGLSAALHLRQRGHKVMVLETQGRVGGRLWSLPLAGGQVAEIGAGWFPATSTLVQGLIQRYKLPLISVNDGCPRLFVDGHSCNSGDLGKWPWELHTSEKNTTIAANLNRYLLQSGINPAAVFRENWPDEQTIERYDSLTFPQLLLKAGCSKAYLKLLAATGGPPYQFGSALGLMSSAIWHFNSKGFVRIAGGNQRLAEAMAAELPGCIQLNTEAIAIEQNDRGVVVSTKSGKEYRADHVISTIPFKILEQLEVKPQFSEAKRRLFRECIWSDCYKGIIQTQQATWLQSGVFGWPMAASDQPWQRLIDLTCGEKDGPGNLFFYILGQDTKSLKPLNPNERVNHVLTLFQRDLPGLVDEVTTKRGILWSEQPWARGAFGGMPVGGAWMIQEWKKPEDRIHFAGDFTTLKSGWVEGALESGLRVAREIDPEIVQH